MGFAVQRGDASITVSTTANKLIKWLEKGLVDRDPRMVF